jgi:UDP-N-acetylmuramate dehydrogenase
VRFRAPLHLTKNIEALVIHIDLKGKKIIGRDDDVWVECHAGENWYEFVLGRSIKALWLRKHVKLIPK